MILRHAFSPPNNTRLAHLCGPLDEHLRTIEEGLQVRIGRRQQHFRVEGPKAKAERAMNVLQALVALGYSDKEATLALKALPAGVGVSEGIKQALKALAR